MKKRLATILAVVFLISRGPSSVAGTNLLALQKVPRSGTVTLRVLKAPGLNLPGSNWEVAYELRMLPENRLFQERAKLNESSTERAGDLIKKATLAKSLASSTGQTLLLEIPFDAPTLAKLKIQPKYRLALVDASQSQVFVIYLV